jgi:Ca2+-binding EF-hand superfamily protein
MGEGTPIARTSYDVLEKAESGWHDGFRRCTKNESGFINCRIIKKAVRSPIGFHIATSYNKNVMKKT